MKRRSFLASILASGVAPAAVGSSILMPVKQIIRPAPGLMIDGNLLVGDNLRAHEIICYRIPFYKGVRWIDCNIVGSAWTWTPAPGTTA